MTDHPTERMVALQTKLTARLEELGFTGVAAANVAHRLAEVAVLAYDVAEESVPLFVEMSAEHRDAFYRLLAHIKWDLDEIRDGITDLEPDLMELMRSLEPKPE